MSSSAGTIQKISPDSITQNKENPRLVFRPEELEELLNSIKQNGILVPLTVYSEGKPDSYVLLDGERRWRCAKKLNLKEVPAIIQPKPTRLENILLMFNIHNVRVQWDPLATAIKLKELQALLIKENKPADARSLAAMTGLTTGKVDRYFDLISLPEKYQTELKNELEKPKKERAITSDLIIEIQQSEKTIRKYLPEVLEGKNKLDYLDTMVNKYKTKVINNVIKFRDISKIARAERAGSQKANALRVIKKLIDEPTYSIDSAYKDSVQSAYAARDIKTRIDSLIDRLERLEKKEITPELQKSLLKLRSLLNKIVG